VDRQATLLRVQREVETITSLGYGELASHLPRTGARLVFFCPMSPKSSSMPGSPSAAPHGHSHEAIHAPLHLSSLLLSPAEILPRKHAPGRTRFLAGSRLQPQLRLHAGTLRDLGPSGTVSHPLHLMIPTQLDSEHSRPYVRAEIERFREFLESHSGKITDGE